MSSTAEDLDLLCAHGADWVFCLVRTAEGGKPQEGISFLLIDMKPPGITIRRSSRSIWATTSIRFSSTTSAFPSPIASARKTGGWTYENSCSATNVY